MLVKKSASQRLTCVSSAGGGCGCGCLVSLVTGSGGGGRTLGVRSGGGRRRYCVSSLTSLISGRARCPVRHGSTDLLATKKVYQTRCAPTDFQRAPIWSKKNFLNLTKRNMQKKSTEEKVKNIAEKKERKKKKNGVLPLARRSIDACGY